MPARRILITRSRHQASELAAQLAALGAETVLIPTIELAPPSSFDPLDTALADLPAFDWLLFTSANAVAAFASRCTLHRPGTALTPSDHRDPPSKNTVKIAAIGPATAGALTGIGLPPDLIPPHAVAESLAQTLLPHTVHPSGKGARMLLIRAETARDHLPETLRSAGADLTVVPAYRTVSPPDSTDELRALFAEKSRWPDAITFTSSSTATNLFALLEAAGIILPDSITRVSIGPITSGTLRELGHPPHLEAPESNIAALVRTIATHLDLQEQG